jgi:phospholipid/cholesterol/gamma-HCH transport system substrate-binding protein
VSDRPSFVRARWVRRSAGLAVAGVATVILAGCGLSLQSLPKVNGFSGPTYPVSATFSNVLNLPADGQVRIGAQVVGEVTAISTRNFQADLNLDIEKSVRLPVGTTAQVRFDDPLGDEYILLQEPAKLSAENGGGTTKFLAPGAHIPESATSDAPSVEDTFGALSLVLNGGGINQLQTIIKQLNATFGGNQAPIRSFLTTIDNGVSSLAGGRQAIDNALASISNLTNKLNAGGNTIATGISTIAPAVGVLASENQQISGLLTQLSNLGEAGTKVAVQSGQNAVADAKDLLPVLQQLEAVSSQLAPDLSTLAHFEAETPKIAPGDYLQVSAVVNVLLPAGASEATPLDALTSADTSTSASSIRRPLGGTQAVTDLLAASF